MTHLNHSKFRQHAMPRLAGLIAVSLYVLSFFLAVTRGLINLDGWAAFSVVAIALVKPDPSGPGLAVKELNFSEWALLFLGFLPNPILWAGIVCFVLGWWRAAGTAGALALGLGLIWIFDSDPLTLDVRKYHVGYYCWLSSMAALAVVALTVRRLHVATGDIDRDWCTRTSVTVVAVATTVVLGFLAIICLCLFSSDG